MDRRIAIIVRKNFSKNSIVRISSAPIRAKKFQERVKEDASKNEQINGAAQADNRVHEQRAVIKS